jgi:hypothetical protein
MKADYLKGRMRGKIRLKKEKNEWIIAFPLQKFPSKKGKVAKKENSPRHPDFEEFTKIEDGTICRAEDYELKFTWAMFNFQSLTLGPPCAGQQQSYHLLIDP